MNAWPARSRWWAVVLVAPAILLVLPPSATAAGPDEAGLGSPEALETLVDDLMEDHFDRFGLAGASVTVVKDGELFISKGYGHADVAAGTPVEADATLFPTASAVKVFTWTAVMQLVEQGKLELDAEVNHYLSAFEIADTFPEPVRVWHLLSHTAGFEDKPQVGLNSRSPDDLPDLETALIGFMPERVWEPGTTTAYSNYSTALAAHLVAEVSGLSWEEYVEENILGPLGMTRASVRQPVPEGLATDVTKVYTSNDGEPRESAFEFHALAPAGSMVATTQDMGRFMLAHLQQGRLGEARILREATAERMHSQLFTHDPRLPGNAHGFWESRENGQRVLSHPGDNQTSHSLLALLPEHDVGFYVAYNSSGGVEARAELWDAFLDHGFPTAAPTAPERSAATRAQMEPFAGTYEINRVSTTTLSKLVKVFTPVLTVSVEDGFLVTDLPGFDRQRWTAVGGNEFADVAGPGRMVFRDDDDGGASHVFFDGSPLAVSSPLFAWVPVSWYDSASLHGGLLAFSLLLVLSALGAWPILALVRRRRQATSPRGARTARRWAAATGGLYLLCIVLVAVSLLDPGEVEFGLPPLLTVALTMGVGAAVLTLGAVVHTVLAWSNAYWSVAGRLHYTLLTLAFVTLVWQLNHWNLLGFSV